MKRIFWDRRGFTLAELLVAAVFGLIVIGTLYGFFREQMFNLLSQETKTATRQDVRGALDIMVRELRNAGSFPVPIPTTDTTCIKDGSDNPFRLVPDTTNANSIQIQADLDGNGNCSATGEKVTYALKSTSTPACPAPSITRNTQCLVANVVTPTGSLSLFTYYPAGTDPPPFCFSTGNPAGCSEDLAANLDDIKRVKITFAVQAANPNPSTKGANPNISSTLSSSVEFRNE